MTLSRSLECRQARKTTDQDMIKKDPLYTTIMELARSEHAPVHLRGLEHAFDLARVRALALHGAESVAGRR